MKKVKPVMINLIFLFGVSVPSYGFEKDVFQTPKGDLTITFIGHGTLMFEFDRKLN